jgi:hypothetical protein
LVYLPLFVLKQLGNPTVQKHEAELVPDSQPVHIYIYMHGIMTGSRTKDSCTKLVTKLEILPLPSLYIFSLLRFVIKNKELFITNEETHSCGTRHCADLHYPSVKLKQFQTAVHYMAVQLYNSLPTYIKTEINNAKVYELLLKKFLLTNSFYSLEEFYNLD